MVGQVIKSVLKRSETDERQRALKASMLLQDGEAEKSMTEARKAEAWGAQTHVKRGWRLRNFFPSNVRTRELSKLLRDTSLSEKLPDWKRYLLDMRAACYVFFTLAFTFDGLVAAIVAAASTVLYARYAARHFSGYTGAPWSWLAVVIVFPLTSSISNAFSRREQAVRSLCSIKSLISHIYFAHRDWNWGADGRRNLPDQHVAGVRGLLLTLTSTTLELLMLPFVFRAANVVTETGRRNRVSVLNNLQRMRRVVDDCFSRLSLSVEVMKASGMPANEASRINQYHWLLMREIEELQAVKFYRTPQGTRSFARIFIVIYSVMYGPYFAQIASDDAEGVWERPDDEYGRFIVYACMLSVLMVTALMALFQIVNQLEDPFDTVDDGWDNVRAHETFVEVESILRMTPADGADVIFADAPPGSKVDRVLRPSRCPTNESDLIRLDQHSDHIVFGHHDYVVPLMEQNAAQSDATSGNNAISIGLLGAILRRATRRNITVPENAPYIRPTSPNTTASHPPVAIDAIDETKVDQGESGIC